MPEGTEAVTDTTPLAGAGSPPVDWEARFKGLQKTLNAKEDEWKAAHAKTESTITAMTQELHEKTGKLTSFEEQLKAVGEQMKALTQERDSLASDAATYETEAARMKVCAAKHAELLEDYVGGLLRTDLTGEDWEKYLDAYAGKRAFVSEQGRQQVLAGSAVAAGSMRSAPATKESLRAQLVDAQRKGDMAAYDAAYSALMALDHK